MGDEDLGQMGGEDDFGGEMGDEMGGEDDLGQMGGENDFSGEELGDLGDEGLGGGEAADDMGSPCPDCNPEGDGDGDPECTTCDGSGYLPPEEGEDADTPGDQDADMKDLMNRMQAYCSRYMVGEGCVCDEKKPAFFKKGDKDKDDEPKGKKKFPFGKKDKKDDEPKDKKKFPFGKKDGKAEKDGKKFCDKGDGGKKKFCGKGCSLEEMLNRQAHMQTKFSNGLQEDLLIADTTPSADPKPGDVGFAPQGKVGAIGGGYTMDDFKDMPTLGESFCYKTWKQFKKSK
jgi:hypothetical protein